MSQALLRATPACSESEQKKAAHRGWPGAAEAFGLGGNATKLQADNAAIMVNKL